MSKKADARKKNVKKSDYKNPSDKAIIRSIFFEMFLFIKSIGLGVFSLADFIVSTIVSFVAYVWWGITNLFHFLWKYGFKFIYTEIYNFFKAIYKGLESIFINIFYEFPIFIYTKISKYVYEVYLKIKNWFENKKKIHKEKKSAGKGIIKTIVDYIVNKYNNISFIKEARERKEASLKVLIIEPTSSDSERIPKKQTYKYIAKDKNGKLITDYFAAQSRLDVYSYLMDEGMTVYEIKTSWAINFFHPESTTIRKKMSNKDLIFWLAQLSTYIKAGVTLTDAVKILAEQDKRRKYNPIYDSIVYELTMGESFSEALRKQGNVFPPLLINMIKSAELIGDIEGTLDEMSNYYQEVEETKKAIINALTYPAIIFVFSIAIVVFMFVYIVPKFVGVYGSMSADIHPITQMTLNISAFFQNEYISLIIIVSCSILVYMFLYRKVKVFRYIMQYIFMHLPVIGKILIYKELSIFARTFATLNKNNILITDSIDILSRITGNEIYKSIMFRTINNLLKGDKMSESFKEHWAIPNLAYYMILTGESTGELAEMLERVGDYYQKEQKNLVNQIKVFIEPVMIVLLAGMVGFIIISILIPLFDMYNKIQ